MDLMRGENYDEEFRKVSPIGRLPVIDDGGFILTECVAIMKYLALKYNVADHWYPRTDLRAQARIDEYLSFQHANTRNNMAMLFQNLELLPTMMNKPINWTKVERYRNAVGGVIKTIDEYFLREKRQFLAGDSISIADIVGICEMMQLYACCEEHFMESNPNVNDWMGRVKQELAPYFEEANVKVYNTRDHFLKTAKPQQKE